MTKMMLIVMIVMPTMTSMMRMMTMMLLLLLLLMLLFLLLVVVVGKFPHFPVFSLSVFVNRVCLSVFVIVRVLRCSVISDVLDLRPHESMASMLQWLKV